MRPVLQAPYLPPPPEYTETPRPDRISGLALLRGVFLSTGRVRSATDSGLIAAGAGFIVLFSVSSLVAYTIVYLAGKLIAAVPLVAIYTYTQPPAYPDPYVGWRIAVHGVRFLAFLSLLRLSPIAGYHGAEHKVVNAIEQTGGVEENVVRRMPPQHLRCGTNLLAGIAPLLLAFTPDVRMSPWLLLGLLVVGVTFRRQIGWVVQTVFTTKEPSPAQLRAGIESGRTLLERWRNTPPRPDSPIERLWRRGLPQVGLGLAVGTAIMHYGDFAVYWLMRQGL
ncbi:MAG: DUF1385 domain-containing protein [Armatimonadetes bacterium]|nr:DUF1385 domain-containing protein [Armatimonadota bacterium]